MAATEPGDRDPDPEFRDELPADLDTSAIGAQTGFPDNSRRRIPGLLYLVLASACVVTWLVARDGALVNDGFLWAAAALAAVAAYCFAAGSRLGLDEKAALVAATRDVGFAVGHASAQLGWRGLRSRPTWRVLLYSADDPPTRRGFVLVDAIDGSVVDSVVEDNPEDWSAPTPAS